MEGKCPGRVGGVSNCLCALSARDPKVIFFVRMVLTADVLAMLSQGRPVFAIGVGLSGYDKASVRLHCHSGA